MYENYVFNNVLKSYVENYLTMYAMQL